MPWAGWRTPGSQITRDFLILQTGRVAQVAISSLSFLLVARILGVEKFGLYSTILASLVTFAALADLGLGQFAMRAVAQVNALETISSAASRPLVYRVSTGLTIVSATIALILTRFDARAALATVLLGVSYLTLQGRSNLERGLWLGQLEFRRSIYIDLIVVGSRLLAILAVAMIGSVTVLGLAVATALTGLAAVGIIEAFLNYRAEAPAGILPRRVAVAALPFALTTLAWNMLAEWPKLGLAAVSGPTATGHLAAASRVLTLAVLPLQTGLNVLTPRLFASARTHDRPALRRGLYGMILFSVVLMIGLLAASPLVPLLLGADYSAAVPILRVLGLSLPFQALAWVAGDWLGGLGRQRVRLAITVIVLVLSIPLTIIAVHWYGAFGAAVAYSISMAVLSGVTVLVVNRTQPPQ